MARPLKEIKHKLDRASGRFMVSFAESPGAYHMTPEADLRLALAWARRNKARLLAAPRRQLLVEPLARGFFASDGLWRKRMAEKGRTMSDKVVSDYDAMMRNHILPLFGSMDVRDLVGRDIDDAILGLDLSTATKYKVERCFKEFLQDLAERHVIANNPLAGVQPFSKRPTRARSAIPREAMARLFPPTHRELIAIYSGGDPHSGYVNGSMWAALMLLFRDTGMRSGEVQRLTWGSLYVDEEAVVVRRARKAGGEEGETKTGAVRAARLSEQTILELEAWREESRHHADGSLVFTLDGHSPVTTAAMGQAFRRGVRNAGLEVEGADWTLYWLRHSFITYALEYLTAREVSQVAGNSEAIAQAVYAHPDDRVVLGQTREARRKLGGYQSDEGLDK